MRRLRSGVGDLCVLLVETGQQDVSLSIINPTVARSLASAEHAVEVTWMTSPINSSRLPMVVVNERRG